MRNAIVAVATLLAACTAAPPVVDGPGLFGTYVVNGVDPVGIEYSGLVQIDRGADPDELVIQWVITGAILLGTGTLDGDTIEVEWTTVTDPRGPSSGTATYTVEPDGRLVGTRTITGVDGVGTEEIFPEG